VTEDLQELPDNPSWLLKQALRAFDKRHYWCASWLCRIAIHRNPNDYFALCKYAQSLYHLGKANDRKAASIYKRAIEVNPTHPLAHAGLGLIHYENAKRIYEEYSMFPGGSWLMFADEKSPENDNERSLTTSYADFQVGNRKIAIKELEEAANLTSDRDDKVELLDMAAEIHCITNIADGIEAYKRILGIAPDYVRAHFYLAGCYAATGKCELALQEYKFITERAPEVATDLESELTRFNIKIDKEC
jgi:tetratricopeptide (TPR) repeat protein